MPHPASFLTVGNGTKINRNGIISEWEESNYSDACCRSSGLADVRLHRTDCIGSMKQLPFSVISRRNQSLYETRYAISSGERTNRSIPKRYGIHCRISIALGRKSDSSLKPEEASAERLLTLRRGHWSIENKSHWMRDMFLEEDVSPVRCGAIPQAMAALHNTALSAFRFAGITRIADKMKYYASKPKLAVNLIN